jgi:transposase
MFYLAVDQHHKQLTISLRDEAGEVVQRRQVSTQPARVREFLEQTRERSAADGGYVVVLEVCGFNDWLLRLLKEYGCRQVALIQPEKQSKKKTDRRDANALGELLWVNRQRLLAGQKIQGVRQVEIVSDEELGDRRLTATRHRLGQQRTRTVNRIHQILRRHNLEWERPTKTFDTRAVRRWLQSLPLPEGDRLEMDQLLAQWRLWDEQLVQLEERLRQRCESNPVAQILMTIIGVSYFAALALASRINDIARFPRPRSLANYFGLTPGCRNSGEATDRLGSITKQGSALVRFILGQLVLHVLKHDGRMRAWYQRIKRRRGAKIARVAVMRRLATVLWHMVKHQQPYQYQRVSVPRGEDPQSAMDGVAAQRHQAEVFAQLGIRAPASEAAVAAAAID